MKVLKKFWDEVEIYKLYNVYSSHNFHKQKIAKVAYLKYILLLRKYRTESENIERKKWVIFYCTKRGGGVKSQLYVQYVS